MKLKRLLFLLLMLFCFIPNVYAKDANVTIKNIEKVKVSGRAEEVSEATINGANLNFNLKFFNIGDYVEYKLEFENRDDVDYNLILDSNDEYVVYELSTDIIKKSSTTEISIIAKYNKDVPDEMVDQPISKTVKINVTDEDGNAVNPHTGQSILFLFVLLSVIIIIVLLAVKNQKVKTMIILLALMMIPVGVYAINILLLTINSTYEIPSSSVVYSLNIAESENDTNLIKIGEQIPSNSEIYNTPEEAMNAWKKIRDDNGVNPFYLKYILDRNGVVEESYIEFVITEEMKNANEGVVPGTYSIRVFKAPAECFNSGGGTRANSEPDCTSPYYDDIFEMLDSAFSDTNRHYYGSGSDDAYWEIPDLSIDPDDNGYINVDNSSNCYCFASAYKDAYCSCSSGHEIRSAGAKEIK